MYGGFSEQPFLFIYRVCKSGLWLGTNFYLFSRTSAGPSSYSTDIAMDSYFDVESPKKREILNRMIAVYQSSHLGLHSLRTTKFSTDLFLSIRPST